MGGERASLLSLYRRVLRANRLSLPPPLRALGDASARAEWRAMKEAAERPDVGARPPDSSWHTFALEWAKYADSLTAGGSPGSGSGGSGELSKEQVEAMTPEQRRSLAALAKAASKAADELLRK